MATVLLPVNGKWNTQICFSICAEHGIRYYSATKTERCFVEELARRAWEEREDERVEL